MHLSATSIVGNKVFGLEREEIGEIEDLMIDVSTSYVEYAVISIGGLLDLGEKLFAVPLAALILDKNDKCFVLPVAEDRLKNAPGFDRSNWPNTANPEWRIQIHSYYGTMPAANS